jgi:hypothetical protein
MSYLLLKQIAESQEVPLWIFIKKFNHWKYTDINRKATYRLIVGLQPNLLL